MKKLIQRLKNLWALSEYAPSWKYDFSYTPKEGLRETRGTTLQRNVPYKPKMATIVSMADPLAEFPKE